MVAAHTHQHAVLNGGWCIEPPDLITCCHRPCFAAQLRLVGGTPGRSGRLELLMAGQWGSVSGPTCALPFAAVGLGCLLRRPFLHNSNAAVHELQVCNLRGANLTFTDRAAHVACRQLGLRLPGRVVRNSTLTVGAGPVFASSFDCSGREARLEACRHGFWGRADGCTAQDAVAIECGYTPPASERAGCLAGAGAGAVRHGCLLGPTLVE